MRRRPTSLSIALMLALISTALFVSTAGASAQVCDAPIDPTFAVEFIDETRAGGEPIITTMPDGDLLWGSHAGTTHFYTPGLTGNPTGAGAFVQEYEGQTYYYFDEADDEEGFQFAPRAPYETLNPTSGVLASGFSDPEFAIDMAGNVYISEINLANIAVSKSSDNGRTYTLQNFFALTASDRQWMEADEEDVLYMSANTFGGGSLGDSRPGVTGSLANRMYKSTDGGKTWGPGSQFFGTSQMSSDFKVDHRDGKIYALDTRLGALELVVIDARGVTLANASVERFRIADEYANLSSIGPTLDLDADGNVYVVWDHEQTGGREGGIWFTYATAAMLDDARDADENFPQRTSGDRGTFFAEAIRVSSGDETAQWPWIVAGDPGNVSITWLENERALSNQNSESASAGDGWNVMVAQSTSVLGCDEVDGDHIPGFNEVIASVDADGNARPVHYGTMCASGTTCQAFAVDRRMGDYFSNELDRDGNTVIAVSDTTEGGPVSLPLAIRQTSGVTLGQGAGAQ